MIRWGVTLRYTSVPSRGGGSDAPGRLMQHGNWDKLRLNGPIGLCSDLALRVPGT